MGCPAEVEIGANLVFSVMTHDPDTGVLTDADAVPAYRIYEDETDPPILTGNMAKLDDDDTTGFYTESIACTSGNGFENGKTYTIYCVATVDGDQGGISYGFKAYDLRKTDAIQISGSAPAANNVESVFLGTGHTDDVDLSARTLKLDSDIDVALEILSSDDSAIKAVSSAAGKHGMELAGNGAGDGLNSTGGATGAGIEATGGATSGAGIKALAQNNNDAGMELVKNGTGVDLDADDLKEITAARMGALTDWINGGRLDLLLDKASGTYLGGGVWIDTDANNTNTVSYVDGIPTNPVSTIAAAKTIADALGLKIFRLSPDSSITLGGAYDGYVFDGTGAIIDLNGQSINGSVFIGVKINGNDDGSNSARVRYESCDIDGSTLGQFIACRCRLTGTITLAEIGTYFLDACYSGVAGVTTPTIDFGAALGVTNLNMRHYSGGIEIENMGNVGADQMSLEGFGQIILNANCDPSNSPVIAIRGTFTVTDNVAGGFVSGGGTLSQDARYDTAQILSAITDDDTQIDASQLNTHTAITPNSVVPDVAGTAAGLHSTTNGLINGLNDVSPAEIDNPIKTDTYTLPGQEAPTATPTLEEAIMYIYKFLTNKRTDDGTNIKVFARDETTVDHKNTILDDGNTYTHGEFGTGP